MADPFTMGAVSIGSTVLSGVLSGIGAAKTADASARSFEYKAGIAMLNRDIAEQNKSWAINAGGVKAANYGLKAGQVIADTKVKQGASGIDVATGSPADVRGGQSDVAKYDQGTIRSDASKQAYGYDLESRKQTAEYGMMKAGAADARDGKTLAILSSVVGTAGSVSSKWYQGNTSGMWSGGGTASNATDGIGGFGPTAPSWST